MFLLVPAYPGCPGSKAVKRSLLLLEQLQVLLSFLSSRHSSAHYCFYRIVSVLMNKIFIHTFCKQNLLLFIQPRWQPMAYFFNHYNILFLMNLHSLSKSNTSSTQILGFIVMTVFYNWPFPHVYFANNVAYIILPFNS